MVNRYLFQKNLYRLKRLMGREELKLYLDVASCNLRCAMCPRGGASGLGNDARGLMSYELFKKIIDKFKAERVRIKELEIGNWGEPLLNEDVARMIRYVKDTWPPAFSGHAGAIGISTNLNYLKNPEGLVRSGVNRIRVSISGMTQEIYSKNHIGGDINKVLANLLQLVEIKNRFHVQDISIGIGYQDLLYNKHQIEMAKKFCEGHGIFFALLRMYIPSVEDNIAFHCDRRKMTKFYENFIDVDDEIRHMKLAKSIEKCQFRRSVITINFDGMVYRCCGVYEPKYALGSFFDFKIRNIPRIPSPICQICSRTLMSWR